MVEFYNLFMIELQDQDHQILQYLTSTLKEA